MKIIKYLVTIIIVVLFFWLAFKDFTSTEIESLWLTLKNINGYWVGLTVVVLGFSNVVRALRWRYLLSEVRTGLLISDFYHATMIGYAINLVLPRVGEISKAVHLSKKTKIDIKQVLASVVVERILDSMIFALFFAVSSFMFRAKLDEVFGDISMLGWSLPIHFFSIFLLILTLVMLLSFTLLVFFPYKVTGLIESFFSKFSEKLSQRLSEFFTAFIEGAGALKQTKNYSVILLSSLGIWGIYLLGTLFPFYSMSFDLEYSLGVLEALATMSIAAFGQLITPAGAGTYQYICQTVLNKVFLVEISQASAFALLVFSIILATYGVLGAYSVFSQSKEIKLDRSIKKDIAFKKVNS